MLKSSHSVDMTVSILFDSAVINFHQHRSAFDAVDAPITGMERSFHSLQGKEYNSRILNEIRDIN